MFGDFSCRHISQIQLSHRFALFAVVLFQVSDLQDNGKNVQLQTETTNHIANFPFSVVVAIEV